MPGLHVGAAGHVDRVLVVFVLVVQRLKQANTAFRLQCALQEPKPQMEKDWTRQEPGVQSLVVVVVLVFVVLVVVVLVVLVVVQRAKHEDTMLRRQPADSLEEPQAAIA